MATSNENPMASVTNTSSPIEDCYRDEALTLAARKSFYKNVIKELSSTVVEGSMELGEATGDLQERVAESEEKLIGVVTELKCKELALKLAQISYKLNGYAGLKGIFTSPTENSIVVQQFEQIYKSQVKYLKLFEEVKELQRAMRKKRLESQELIIRTRRSYSKIKKLKKENEDDERTEIQEELRLKELLKRGTRTYNIARRVFLELIFCSKLNWYEDQDLKKNILMLEEKLEFD